MLVHPGAWITRSELATMSNDTPIPEGYKRCTRCGTIQRREMFSRDARAGDGLHSWCKACASAYHREYRETHRDALNQASSDYYYQNLERLRADGRRRALEHKEEKAAYDRQYREKNKEAISARRKRHYKANVEKISEYKREYHQRNAEKLRAKTRRWHEQNPERTRANVNIRRARKAQARGNYTADESHDILERQGGNCLYCGASLDSSAHLDHFVPLSRGGRNSKENLVWACSPCNRSKGALLPWNWHGWNGATPVFWDGELF